MKHVMIDIETMDNRGTAAIIAIGAVSFGMRNNIRGGDVCYEWDINPDMPFYKRVSLQSCIDAGLTVNADTIAWWMKQSDEARHEFIEGEERAKNFEEHDKGYAVPIKAALGALHEWFRTVGARYVWGNGSDFDNAILQHAHAKLGLTTPWQFWNNRCLRTLKFLKPDIKIDAFQEGTKHTALADALAQAKQACAILNALGVKE
jgi:DNA polymerase III epsilon subunit-like protein